MTLFPYLEFKGKIPGQLNPQLKNLAYCLVLQLLIVGSSLAQVPGAETASGDFPVAIEVDTAKSTGAMPDAWRFFGYDEANYTYMKDGKKLLSELGELGGPQVYIRCHHLLTSGDGEPALKWGSTNAYTEDAGGKPVYDWSLVDRIFDTYLQRGLKPYVQIGFMPEALSIHPQNYPHDPPPGLKVDPGVGFSYPPKDYAKWGELSYQWARHCIEKHGRAEVEQWYWEVWNEPNISYWRGKPEEYFKLYDFAVDGVRRALPSARVGGPETAGGPGGNFLRDFLNHCAYGKNDATGKTGAPLDFISFHAKGSPKFVAGHVEMGLDHQLANMRDAFSVVASFPEYKNTPLVIGESDPEGCAACKGPQDGYRNGTMYSSYTAASFPLAYELAEKQGVNLQGALTWAFEFEDQPYFAGFRVLASNGLDLPVLNVFRAFAQMKGQRLAVTSSSGFDAEAVLKKSVRATPDVSAMASLEGNRLCVLFWHYHDDDVPGPSASIDCTLRGLPGGGSAKIIEYRIDEDHGNAFSAWKKMGSPVQPTREQYVLLEKAGRLAPVSEPRTLPVEGGTLKVKVLLPRQAVVLLTIAR